MAKVRSDDIETGAVNSRILADGAIQRRHLSAGVIGAGHLGSGVVSGDTIATHGIISDNLSDGVVTAPKVGDDAIVARHIMDGTLEVAKFAESLRPVQLVDALPALPDPEYPLGAVVFHKVEGKLYRNDGTGWTAAVPTGDLFGEITETQIANDAITTPKLAANAVVAKHILAGEVLADHLAANSVIAGKIQAGAVSTSELAAGAVSADKIKANAVGATQLAAMYLEVGKYIRSSNYVAGSAGWAIDADGNAELNDATFRGDIVAATMTGGTITGAVFKTASSGERIEMGVSSTQLGFLKVFNGNGSQIGHIGTHTSTGSNLLVHNPTGNPVWIGDPQLNEGCQVHGTINGAGLSSTLLQFGAGASPRSGTSASGDEIQSRPGASTTGYNGFAGGFFRTVSSQRYKNDIEDAPEGAVATLAGLRVRRFTDRSPTARRRFGLVAEELPDSLHVGDGYDLTEMVALCIQSIQELARGR